MFATLLLHLDLDADNARLMALAGTLAERFNANLTGLVATRPLQSGGGDSIVPTDVIERDLEDKRARIDALEKAFRTTLRARQERLRFHSQIALQLPSDYIVEQMRGADLLVTGIRDARSWLDPMAPPGTADLVLRAGRPVLAVPAAVGALGAETVLVGWKDTAPSRRAIADALPFLRLAHRVIVAEVVEHDDATSEARRNTRQVCDWLASHGIAGELRVLTADEERIAPLAALAAQEGADLIVAGAYGHSRVREWVLGGVTRELLRQTERCVLFSH